MIRYHSISNLLILLLLAGCASAPKTRRPAAQEPSIKRLPLSVELTYLRGHNSRKFIIKRTNLGANIQEFRDHQLLKNISVEGEKTTELLERSSTVFSSIENQPVRKDGMPCRTPFALRITNQESVGTVEGCRNSEEGNLIGKFVSEVEFLISSRPAQP